MKRFGLLGERLGHSFSPQIHKMLGGYDYELFEVEPEKLDEFMKAAPFDGINVTIPYKKAVIPYCDFLSDEAIKTGSVNTIIKLPDGRLKGCNTDYFGFIAMMQKNRIPVGRKALILGDGGVAPTVHAALETLGSSEIIRISRRGENNYLNLSCHFDADLIVNTTPVGMYPDNMQSVIAPASFASCRGVVDLIYNPLRTKLVLDSEALGMRACGGLYMLVSQAAKASELFTGLDISEEKLNEVYISILNSVRSIALIGMPGCGKTSAGRALSLLTGRELYDCDEEIVSKIGMSIPDFFEKYGVAAFRDIETEVLAEITKKSGIIISTGGGAVMRSGNLELLRQNAEIVFLDRDIDSLPTEGRPLSQKNSLRDLADMRLPIYRKWCDKKIKASSPEEAAMMIKECLKL